MVKKLTIIIPNLSFGGAEKVTCNLIEQLMLLGDIDVDLILLKPNDIKVKEDTEKKIAKFNKNVNVIFSPYARISVSCFFLLKYFVKNKDRKILTVLNSVNSIVLLCNLFLFRKMNITVTVHDNFSNELKIAPTIKNKIINYCVRYLYATSNNIIAVSDGIKNNLFESYTIPLDKIFRIYNPVLKNGVKMSKYIEHPWITSNKEYKIVLAVGTLRPQKNFSLLISAFKNVHDVIGNARLIILGDGPMKEELGKLVESLGLENYVDLYGYSDNVSQFMSVSDLFVLSSRTEALPTVLIEALSMNLSIVSTDCQFGPREILKDGEYGCLVPTDDCRAMSDAIIRGLFSPLHYTNDMSQYYLPYATDEYIKVIFGDETN